MKKDHITRRELLASSALFAMEAPAFAQALGNTTAWPSRPIKIVVPGPAGVGGDIFARMLAGPLQDVFKQLMP